MQAIPVPNQKYAFEKIEERQRAARSTSNAPMEDKGTLTSSHTKEIPRIPSVEEIGLPES